MNQGERLKEQKPSSLGDTSRVSSEWLARLGLLPAIVRAGMLPSWHAWWLTLFLVGNVPGWHCSRTLSSAAAPQVTDFWGAVFQVVVFQLTVYQVKAFQADELTSRFELGESHENRSNRLLLYRTRLARPATSQANGLTAASKR